MLKQTNNTHGHFIHCIKNFDEPIEICLFVLPLGIWAIKMIV